MDRSWRVIIKIECKGCRMLVRGMSDVCREGSMWESWNLRPQYGSGAIHSYGVPKSKLPEMITLPARGNVRLRYNITIPLHRTEFLKWCFRCPAACLNNHIPRSFKHLSDSVFKKQLKHFESNASMSLWLLVIFSLLCVSCNSWCRCFIMLTFEWYTVLILSGLCFRLDRVFSNFFFVEWLVKYAGGTVFLHYLTL